GVILRRNHRGDPGAARVAPEIARGDGGDKGGGACPGCTAHRGRRPGPRAGPRGGAGQRYYLHATGPCRRPAIGTGCPDWGGGALRGSPEVAGPLPRRGPERPAVPAAAVRATGGVAGAG